ncbi:MAG: beta-lactamase superfamily II metal-dependent hydrolase [Crocinitomix sp.]|jgi:beta-lactamase superfamily II metal-dependent hydrolase
MSRLQIHHLDVGQGDSTLILYYDDNDKPTYSVLIDCGENAAYLRVIDILFENRFQFLNTILLTHYDSDHFSGVIKLIERGVKTRDDFIFNLLAGTQIWDPGIPGDILEKNFFNNYIIALENLIKKQRAKGVGLVHRVTGNMNGRTTNSIGSFNDFTLREFDGWLNDSYVVKDKIQPEWFVPFRSITAGKYNRITAYRQLFKNKHWPISMDVVNYGRGLALIDDQTTDFPEQVPLPFSIDILIGNGTGVKNEEEKDPLIAMSIDQNVEKAWRDRILNEAGGRRLSITQSNDENDLGMGYLLKFENFRYWFGGDLTSNQEDALTDAIGQLSVLKAGHHGSHHSSSIRFLAETMPKAVIISTASEWNERVKLPHVSTLGRFESCPSIQAVFMTGMPIPKKIKPSFLPGPTTPYDANRKFQVAGTDLKASSEIILYVDSSEAVNKEHLFEVRYREQNVSSKGKKRKQDANGEEVRQTIKKRRKL